MSTWDRFIEHYNIKGIYGEEQILELLEKFEDLLGRPVEQREITTLVSITYPKVNKTITNRAYANIAKARKSVLKVLSTKDILKILRLKMNEGTFKKALKTKTDLRLIKMAKEKKFLKGTDIAITEIAKQREKIGFQRRCVFFVEKNKIKEAGENFRRFWSENQ